MRNIIKRILKEQYGEGHDECGIYYYDTVDDDFFYYYNLRDSVVNYPKETMELFHTKEKESLPTDQVVYSSQDYIDLDYVSSMDDNIYKKSDIHIVEIDGMLFILDGHHRLCRDRMNGNPSMVYIWDKEDIELIDCIFYGIGDC